LNRNVEPEFNPDRKDNHWGAASWRAIGEAGSISRLASMLWAVDPVFFGNGGGLKGLAIHRLILSPEAVHYIVGGLFYIRDFF
jgi:hypothetical protein